MTLETLAKQVKCSSVFGAKLPWEKQNDWQKSANGYAVTLMYKRRRYTVDFWMGSAHTDEPDAAGVLDCLLSDADLGSRCFEDFCAEVGYDADSRKAERQWKACQRHGVKLQRLLGADYETFLMADR